MLRVISMNSINLQWLNPEYHYYHTGTPQQKTRSRGQAPVQLQTRFTGKCYSRSALHRHRGRSTSLADLSDHNRGASSQLSS